MQHTKTAGSPRKSAPKFFANSFVAASLLVGGASLLNAGGAQAATTCTPSTDGFYTMSMVNDLSGPVPGGSPACQLSDIMGIGSVKTSYLAADTGTGSPVSGETRYSISTTNGYKFTEASANMDIAGTQNGTLTKTIYADSGYTMLIGTVTSTGGVAPFVGLSDTSLTTIYVKDSWTVDGMTQLNSTSNNFKATPGPLPLLGAGAAFGFSRKLRTRIKATA